jgi:hypothetical protein
LVIQSPQTRTKSPPSPHVQQVNQRLRVRAARRLSAGLGPHEALPCRSLHWRPNRMV